MALGPGALSPPGAGSSAPVSHQLFFIGTAVFFMALQPVIVTLSQGEDGRIGYSVPTCTLLTEALKMLISSVLLVQERLSPTGITNILSDNPLLELLKFFVPGLLYMFTNNMSFIILEAIDPVTFQLLSQLKTIFTGILFRMILGRNLELVQWLALVVLACGTAVTQLKSSTDEDLHPKTVAVWIGVGLSVLTAIGSSLAGVYSEKLLKDRVHTTIHWQNIQLYFWGIVTNYIGILVTDTHRSTLLSLDGFTASAWVVVIFNAAMGLSISGVLKFADNIARVYAHAVAMLVTMVLSAMLFHTTITPNMLISVILVTTSTLQYNLPAAEKSGYRGLVVGRSNEEDGLYKAYSETELSMTSETGTGTPSEPPFS